MRAGRHPAAPGQGRLGAGQGRVDVHQRPVLSDANRARERDEHAAACRVRRRYRRVSPGGDAHRGVSTHPRRGGRPREPAGASLHATVAVGGVRRRRRPVAPPGGRDAAPTAARLGGRARARLLLRPDAGDVRGRPRLRLDDGVSRR